MSIEKDFEILFGADKELPFLSIFWGTINVVSADDICVFLPGDEGFIRVAQKLDSSTTYAVEDKVVVARIADNLFIILGKLVDV